MTNADSTIQLVRYLVRSFLEHHLAAADLVRLVDDLVANDRLIGLDTHAMKLIEELHESLALYVSDEATRQEEPSIYIGDDELRRKAVRFISKLEVL